jgi:CheY-like chemotaxis protein
MIPARRNILLIDDDPAIRQILLHILEEENYFVLAVANGVEVFTIAETTKFDLVLLDMNMPVKDGWETFEQLSLKNPLLPIILITAYPHLFSSALASGASALLEKPLDFVQLFYTIRNLLETNNRRAPDKLHGAAFDISSHPAENDRQAAKRRNQIEGR